MTKQISLSAFLRSKRFGELAIDDSIEAMAALLGTPDYVSRGWAKVLIHCFGQSRVEVSSERGRVVLIAFYPLRGTELAGEAHVVDDLPCGLGGSPEAFVRWLTADDMDHEIIANAGVVEQVRVLGGASAVFVDGRLDSLQAS